ncbi:uncharacterized protein DC041_0007423 [Schistosoma bovis]|uniref:LIM zinc-binding domain-containing protein n=1 Tax=Schistosoma bovis TaxID=6184 RepID=A0A430QQX2_SCHBO|nr:uncharacterized protein DC041_0007423 [Schistosoma bovis]
MEAGGNIWHKRCFCCSKCDMLLNFDKSENNPPRVKIKGHHFKPLLFYHSFSLLIFSLNNYNQSDRILYCKKHFQEEVLAKNTQTPI